METEEHTLGNKHGLNRTTNILEGQIAFVRHAYSNCIVLGTSFTLIRVAEHARYNDSGEVGALGAADEDGGDRSQDSNEGGETNTDGENAEAGIHASVKLENSGPVCFRRFDSKDALTCATAQIEAGVVTTTIVQGVIILVGKADAASVDTHEGRRND